jgi:chaperonin GroEL (HSP60 family)
VTEMGSAQVTFFRTNPKDTHISTIIIRGATPNILDDVERAIDDGVNVYKVGWSGLEFLLKNRRENDIFKGIL